MLVQTALGLRRRSLSGECRDGSLGPVEAGSVDREPVIEGKARMARGGVGDRGGLLQLRDERGERVGEVGCSPPWAWLLASSSTGALMWSVPWSWPGSSWARWLAWPVTMPGWCWSRGRCPRPYSAWRAWA